jgi:hypothetical protein
MKGLIKILIAIIILAALFFLLRRCSKRQAKIIYHTQVRIDTTKVDSLEQVVSHWKQIAKSKRDTVIIDTVKITSYIPLDDSLSLYTTNYHDSTLSAQWKTKVKGQLKNQQFQYSLKRQKVKVKTKTKTITKVKTVTNTIVKDPTPYLSVGAFGGVNILGPKAALTFGKGYTISIGYNLIGKGALFGFSVPIGF